MKKPRASVWCEPCHSYHVIPKSAKEHAALMCAAPFKEKDKIAARLVRDSKRRMKGTNLGKLQALQAERQRWERKQTIAGNKLREVRRAIETLAEDMARKTVETEWEGKTNG